MDEEVDGPEAVPDGVEGRVDGVELLDVAGHHEVGAERLGQRLDALAERLALVGEGEFGALGRQRLGDAPGDRVVVGDPHDEAALAAHQAARGGGRRRRVPAP